MKRFAALAALIAFVPLGAAAAPRVTLADAWSRPAIGTGVVYVRVLNSSNRALRIDGARSPVARAVELHETVSGAAAMPGMKSMPGMKMDNVVSMRRVASVTVPAHGSVAFDPGHYHIMLIGLRHDLRPGGRVPLQLHVGGVGWLSVTSHVRSI